MSVLDARGQVVTEIEIEPSQLNGRVSWNGESASDNKVPHGAYHVVVSTEGYGKQPIAAEALERVRLMQCVLIEMRHICSQVIVN